MLDFAKILTNLLFSTIGRCCEKHLPGQQFSRNSIELATQLEVPASTETYALSKDEEPWSRPVNKLDEQTKYYDIRLNKIKHNTK